MLNGFATEGGFVQLRGADAWRRASFDDAALLDGVVQLARRDDPADAATGPPVQAAGLAFDAACRLFRSRPDEGRVERLLWAQHDPLALRQPQPEPVPLFEEPATRFGDFASATAPGPLRRPLGLAVDGHDRLWIAEHAARRVTVFDLWHKREAARFELPGRPLGLAARGDAVLVCTEDADGLWRLRARRSAQRVVLPEGATAPSRIAWHASGAQALLCRAGTAEAVVIDLAAPRRRVAVPFAGDIAWLLAADLGASADGDAATDRALALVVARRPGEALLRFTVEAGSFAEAAPLTARGYDGRGIAATPDQRIAHFTAAGLRHAVIARPKYAASGRVVGFRLDAGVAQARWGRLVADACVPRDTTLAVHCIATDEDDLPPERLLARLPPANLPADAPPVPHAALSPPMPEAAAVPPRGTVAGRLHRRTSPPVLPWLQRRADDGFAEHEGFATDTPGRWLWVVLELGGNTRSTPRVRAVRVERPAHALLGRLPQVLWREPESERFLHRFLAPLAGLMSELDLRSLARHALVDARSAPDEALAWLAGFVGLVCDQRWPAAVRRRLIAEAIPLFRLRGTPAGLARWLALVTGVANPVVVEHFRLRGGAVIGNAAPGGSRAIVGAGLRVGGQVGTAETTPLAGDAATAPPEDAFETHAHRFTVMLPALLSDDTLAQARWVLERHRPAHTLATLCAVEAGMRVGVGLHVGLSSVVGQPSQWQPLRVGASALGRGATLGRPLRGELGTPGRVGQDLRLR